MIASPKASFGLPEVTVGLYAAAGGLPRIIRNVGLQIASELAMTGRRLSAKEVRLRRQISAPHVLWREWLTQNHLGVRFPPDQ